MQTVLKKGFTLIELMVVITIIAILTTIVMANLNSAKSKARDGKRISDLTQIQLVLELVFDKCDIYPSTVLNTNINANICTVNGTDYSLSSFISKIPKDPLNGNEYQYKTDNSAYDYRLGAVLENPTNLENASPNYSILCGSSNLFCVSPK